MYPLKFTDVDLDANRQGYLSDAQRKRIDADVETIHKYNRYVFWVFAGCIVLLLGVGVVSELRTVEGDLSRLFSPDMLTGFGIVAVTFLATFGVIVLWNRRSVSQLAQGEVMSIEGKAEVVSKYTYVRGMRVPMHRLHLHRGWFRRFTLYFPTADSLRYFKQGRQYRVYYVRYAMPYPLSVEEIDEKDKREA